MKNSALFLPAKSVTPVPQRPYFIDCSPARLRLLGDGASERYFSRTVAAGEAGGGAGSASAANASKAKLHTEAPASR